MKYYVTIISVFLFILCLVGCRANRSVDRSLRENIESDGTLSSFRTDSTSQETRRNDSVRSIKNEVRYIRTTGYRPDGTIEFVQEEWMKSGSTELAVSVSESSNIHVSKQETDSTYKIKIKKLETEQLKTFVDTRPVQGIDWLWIIIAVLIVVFVVFIWYKRK